MNLGDKLRFGAAIGVLALAGLAFASPGVAGEPDGKGDDKRVEKIIIVDRSGANHAGTPGDGHVRTFEIRRMDMANCSGGDRTVRESSDEGKRTKVIICRRDGPHAGAGGHGAHGGPGGHGGHVDGTPRIGAFAIHGELADCIGGERDVTETNEKGKHRKIVLCAHGDGNPAQRVERLERALNRLTTSDQLTAEQKERVTAALRGAIERLRTTP